MYTTSKILSEQLRNPEDLDMSLKMEFGSFETIHKWKRMSECYEFVGAKRSKHTAVAYKDAIYVFGGDNGKSMLNDLLRFDIREMSWTKTGCMGTPPAPRYHHSAVVHGSSMFVFGGYTGDILANSNLTNKNDLFEYKFPSAQWVQWKFSGEEPVPRSAHGAAVYDNKLWIFAGYDGNARLNDMWTVNLYGEHRQWVKVDQKGECPPTCCNFPVAVARGKMYVFSGQSGANITNALFQFDFNTHTWRVVSSVHVLRVVGGAPARRYGHIMAAHYRHLYVFGGSADSTLPNDLHCFDLDTHTWSVVQPCPSSQVPAGRLFHAAAVVGDALYIFGGTVDNNIRCGELYRFQLSSYPRCTLHEDFGGILRSHQFCDVILLLGPDRVPQPAHQAMLAARSHYLLKKIKEAREELSRRISSGEETVEQYAYNKPQLTVCLPEAKPDAFKMLLEYIYTDRIDPTQKGLDDNPASDSTVLLVLEVLRLARRLSIPRLAGLCARFLRSNLQANNVLSALHAAHHAKLTCIKEYCLRFPVDPVMKKQWVNKTARDPNWVPQVYGVVCSKHFSADCFIAMKTRRRLLNSAIPTLLIPKVLQVTIDPDGDCISNDPNTSLVTPMASVSECSTMDDHTSIPSTSCKTPTRKRSFTLASPSVDKSPRKKWFCRRVMELSTKLKNKNKQIKRLQSKSRYLSKKVSTLRQILTDLEKKNFLSSEKITILDNIGVHNKEIVKRQLAQANSKGILRTKYSPELRRFALTLNFYSTRAYKYVRKAFSTCLPSLKTISKWYQCIDGRPGFTKEALIALKMKSEKIESYIHCALILDEMKIYKKVEFHPASQRTFGYVDFGANVNTDCNDECSEALVFLIVPLSFSFKIPIGYFLINGMSGEQKASLVDQAITLCHEQGIIVTSVTFDGCPANLAMAKILGCNLDPYNLKTNFYNAVTKSNIVIFLDPCHMVKLVRNTFECYNCFYDSDSNSIKWDHIVRLHKLQNEENFHLANKLRDQHVNFKQNVMKVKLATQIFSRSVAEALLFCKKLKLEEFQDVDATCNMLLLLNDLFDILDSKVHGYGFKRAMNKENKTEIFNKFDECKNYLLSLKTKINKKNKTSDVDVIKSPRFTGFLGLCVAIESAKYLYNSLIETNILKYISFHRLSQDHIELFFCNIRAHGGGCDNPTARQFETIYKKILGHVQLLDTSTGNCIPLENVPILNCTSAIERINCTTVCREEPNEKKSEILVDQHELDMLALYNFSQFAENVIEYIAGFVVNSLSKRIKCKVCIRALVSLTENKNSLIYVKDKGGLLYPSEYAIKLCKRSESAIKTYFIEDFHKRVKKECRSDFFVTMVLRSFLGQSLFPEYSDHDTLETNHIVDLAKCVIKKYVDTRLAFLTKSVAQQPVVRRVYKKLIHFKSQ